MQSLPKHVAFIMDGNRRWARSNKLKLLFPGYRNGVDVADEIVRHAFDLGIGYVTIFAFSSENWNRAYEEVAYLMDLFREGFKEKVGGLIEEDIKIIFIGNRERLPKDIQEMMSVSEQESQGGERGTLAIALSYGGRDEIVRATRRIVAQGLKPEEIDEEVFAAHLDTRGIPDPELIIRTGAGGRRRLSGFFPYQGTYSEFYVTDTLWPDFTLRELDSILEYFSECVRNDGA